jgi:hypothetical protein
MSIRKPINSLIKSTGERYHPFICKGIGEAFATFVITYPASMLLWNGLMSTLPPLYQKYCQDSFKEQQLIDLK